MQEFLYTVQEVPSIGIVCAPVLTQYAMRHNIHLPFALESRRYVSLTFVEGNGIELHGDNADFNARKRFLIMSQVAIVSLTAD